MRDNAVFRPGFLVFTAFPCVPSEKKAKMGSYLSEPVTEKVSSDEANDKFVCGASSMQGWRVSQEDAHNSILNFDENSAFFAVYDGHGGHEVAQYCSQKLPDFIKSTEAYKNGDIEQALIEGFLKFDASIATPEVVAVLKEIAGDKEAQEDSDEEENVSNLYEEATMPIEKVIEKYTNLVNPTLKGLKKGEKLPRSPMISAKKDGLAATSSSTGSEATSSKDVTSEGGTGDAVTSSSTAEVNGEDTKESVAPKDPLETDKPESNGSIPEIKVTCADSSESKEAKETDKVESGETPNQNGDVAGEGENKDDVTSSNDGDLQTNKGKGKSPMKKDANKSPINLRPKRNATQLYKKLLDFKDESEEDEDTEDEEDKTFEGPGEESSGDEGVNIAIEAEGSEEESSEDVEEEEEEEEEDEEVDDDEDDLEFARNMKEEPGSDSGCTAVVALLEGKELYVANAGDSRCIVCRNGKAIEMSLDHKPEDQPERMRIVRAGGKVTADGRVNGGLNLSRALGDHAYKQNKDCSDRDQMITALPDVKKLTVNPSEDEFMVLACDGIWNFMSSQEVVDFIRPRLDTITDKVSHICEEMFDHCLAPNTMGDGTGCDNMTAIIVKFKSNLKKRSASPEPTSREAECKRAKTEGEETSAKKS